VADYYDEIKWIKVDPRTQPTNLQYGYLPANEHGFVACQVSKVEAHWPRSKKVYNLQVEEDESYIAKGFVVHNCSKHERLDVLNVMYDLYEREGVTEVFNTGNWIEGEMRLNRHDIKVFGLDGQVDYFIDNYPQRPNITTYFVAGDDHEGWYQRNEQIEIGRYAEMRAQRAGRADLKYMGYVEADVEFKVKGGSRIMRVMHPGGGSAYALSYSAQKLVESFQGGEKPSLFLYGHYHKFDYNFYREVYCIGTGCTVDQSIFMRKCKIQAHVGGCLVKFTQAPDGAITSVDVRWCPFYDKGYYLVKRGRKFLGASKGF
jgi:hypothetical protein